MPNAAPSDPASPRSSGPAPAAARTVGPSHRAWLVLGLGLLLALAGKELVLRADPPKTKTPAATEPERGEDAAEATGDSAAPEDSADKADDKTEKQSSALGPDEPLPLPKGWPKDHPAPLVRSNCMVCHLNAGRELTLAVHDFALSTHDLEELSCFDCHGGNTEDDETAHDNEFGFIGTKLSALLGKCADCHAEPAKQLAAGPHHWDFSKRINTKYPMCLDCHGNHDVGNPPDDFTLKSVCEDCHEEFDKEMPAYAALIGENDRLWKTMLQVRQKRPVGEKRVPAELEESVSEVRHRTMDAVHRAQALSADQAAAVRTDMENLRGKLEKWLREADQQSATSAPTRPQG